MLSSAWSSDVDRKSTRLNSSHTLISYAVFCLKKKKIASAGRTEGGGGLTREHERSESPLSTRPLPSHAAARPARPAVSFSVHFFFFFNDRAPPEFSPLSLPAALPI